MSDSSNKRYLKDLSFVSPYEKKTQGEKTPHYYSMSSFRVKSDCIYLQEAESGTVDEN